MHTLLQVYWDRWAGVGPEVAEGEGAWWWMGGGGGGVGGYSTL